VSDSCNGGNSQVPSPSLTFRAHTTHQQALLLTGTGVTNQAAIHAGGLNAKEAKRHFREAVASGEEGVAGTAAEALEWCEMEVCACVRLGGYHGKAGVRCGRGPMY